MSSLSVLTTPVWTRRVLWLDAVTGVGTALLQLEAQATVSSLLGMPAALVQASAWVVLVFVVYIGFLLAQRELPRAGVRLLALGNGAWVVASLWLALGAGVALSPLGVGYVLAQAAFVGMLAYLQAAAST
ncbi:hypothetical protein [Rhodoferax saidenbachensis]|uniref:Transporter n=1 Tax=Rhodoferax saidenbachensis TaxID=1484693 RepID=A0ABU1ZV27_9BURK|nr:hypothetical protein [Rhodoferax saidenbachensis]MDR7308831.1 hypothetical protein [Rhodoferax saidenbachensis]